MPSVTASRTVGEGAYGRRLEGSMSPGQLLEQDTHPAGRTPHVNVARARAGSRALRVQHIRLRVWCLPWAHSRTCAPATLPPHHFSAAILQYSCSSAAHVVISISPAPTLGHCSPPCTPSTLVTGTWEIEL
ncbi:hypothetical protein PHLGIDRAFT_401243 [Phlebiopsis gigantea 11061_1 CR5-6]|uniref:Uncharacterized protein n=1 Tax=Phlebiopsis gigantea (strain 11061_1 CR5-6) TaxID=745531 RepID=A0A0C3SBH6_PHLG1|nr:hypothetical protein PHLGIDRAFT_401243 [Phlebiopsis gigantea 11061_1 CR5-6]